MGASCSRKKPLRILFQGLDAAGKTTILYRLKLGEVVTTIPTIGFNVEQISMNGIEITCWDVGGRDKIRPLYRHYYPNTDGFVYIIDSNDKERLEDALDELNCYLLKEEETQDKVIMILANKQDIDGALSTEVIEDKVRQMISSHEPTLGGRTLFVKGCSALVGDDLLEAFASLSEAISKKRAGGFLPGFTRFDSQVDEKKDYGDGKESQFHFLKKFFDLSYTKSLLFN